MIEAAKKRGQALVLYTANVAEVEQHVIKAFNKRFPFIKVEMLRAPGGQLITRVKTEAAAGKLRADVIDHSDRALMADMADLFQDYAPPNAADYLPEALVSPKLWPRITLVWSIAYNSALVKNPPKTWMDLTKPEYANKQIGQVFAPSGGTTWTRVMFERQVLGEDYWKKQAATNPCCFPPARRFRCAGARRSRDRAAALQHRLSQEADGAPVEIFFPPEGAPVEAVCQPACRRRRPIPTPRKLFLNWCLSEEGQTFMIKELGNLTSLKNAAGLSRRLRSEGGQGVGAELRAVREAAQRLGRGVEQDLRLSAVSDSSRHCLHRDVGTRARMNECPRN